MNDFYFYKEDGHTVGPINGEDIKARIKDGRIRVFDLIYRDGEAAWRMALEHPTLRGEFKATTLASLKEKPWVCLQRKPGGKGAEPNIEFVTTGPFSFAEIRESLLSGKVSYSDYAWKDSFADWKRIGSLEEFNPRARTEPTPPRLDLPGEELLKNVVEMKRGQSQLPLESLPENLDSLQEVTVAAHNFALPPSESAPKPALNVRVVSSGFMPAATAPDLPPALPQAKAKDESTSPTLPLESDNTDPIRIHSPNVKDEERLRKEEERARRKGKSKSRRKRPQPWLDWGLVGVLLLILAGTVLIVSRFVSVRGLPAALEAQQSPELSVESQPATPPPVATHPEPLQTLPAPPLPAVANTEREDSGDDEEVSEPPKVLSSHRPTELHLSVHSAGMLPKIEIHSDGSADFPVYVQVIGAPGQVSDATAFYRFLKVLPPGKLQKAVDLSALKLPQGKFMIHVETGDLKKEQRFSSGTSETQYRASVVRQRKLGAHAIWKERLQLLKLSQTLENSLTQGLVPTKKFSSHGLEALSGVNRSNGGNYLMFEDWWELHQIVIEAKSGATSALVARAQKEHERLATFSVWK